jgi:hypothetical protein
VAGLHETIPSIPPASIPSPIGYAVLPETDEVLIATVMHTSRDAAYVTKQVGDFPQSKTP